MIGSVPYMSPEQAQGHAIDARSDVFGFGVLVYEMLTGHRPFSGSTSLETVAKILEATPAAVEAIRTDVPSATCDADRVVPREGSQPASAFRRSVPPSRLDPTITRGLEHEPRCGVVSTRGRGSGGDCDRAARRCRRVVVGVRPVVREARRQLPQVLALAERGDNYAFYFVAAPLVRVLSGDPDLLRTWRARTAAPPLFSSDPPGAELLVKAYGAAEGSWLSLGHTPLEGVRLPLGGTARVRLVKPGFEPYDGTPTGFLTNAVLDRAGSVPPDMVRVPRGTTSVEGNASDVASFLMDRHETTNHQFKAFVDAGGYSRKEFWTEPFIVEGRVISWAEAGALFRDRTGRPGPSTWELGSFPEGQADFPVGGVSWYEAAAFAAYSGKSLPTAYQWITSADFLGPSGLFGEILQHGTFNAKGATAVGTTKSVAPYGQYHMAGNIKEWCWNESGGGRMILGGGWNEPTYMYADRDAQPAFSRAATHGIRLVKNVDPQPANSYARVPPAARNYTVEKPIDDAAFAIVKNLYAFDPSPLDGRLDTTETAPDWRHETVTFNAAYGHERIIAHLYLPKSAAPPYQTVVYFPGGDAPLLRSSRDLNLTNVDFLIRSGRALVYPVYQGTYERPMGGSGPNTFRDLTIARVKDFSRVVEYLETRGDLDTGRLGYYGVSLGALTGTVITALEPRIKASVFLGGGLTRWRMPTEIDPLNFVPRIRTPTLMVNGVSDFQYPLKASQLPEFELLALPPERKRHALFDGGHLPNRIHDVMREMLDWYDRFLGPVTNVARP